MQLLYLHGSGCTEDSFKAQVSAFEGSDALSLPGHPAGQALESIEACASWLSHYVRWKRCGPAVVAGNSLGGAVALRWALEYPQEVGGLILLGSGARLRVSSEIFAQLDSNWPACIDSLVDLALAPNASSTLRERVKGWHLVVGRESTRRDYAACNDFDVIDRLSEIQTPTLIIVGSLDRMTPLKYSTFLHEHIEASSLEVIEGAGHIVMAEKPDAVNDAIAKFLTTLP